MLQKITYAGTAGRSFAEASATLHHLADLAVDPKQVERVTERIGAELLDEVFRDSLDVGAQFFHLGGAFLGSRHPWLLSELG